MPTIHSSPVHFIPPAGVGLTGQTIVATDNVGHSTWGYPTNVPPNGINIFVSQAVGNNANTGTYLKPLATFGAALTLAGAPPPTQPVIIIGLDGNQYNEQLVITNPNVYISAPFAQITWGGAGDTLTINATASGTLLDIASVANTAAGNAIVNNMTETVLLKSLILSQGDIVNNGTGAFLIDSDLITVNITNPGGGNVFYDAAIRVGTDGTGVFGINSTGSTAPAFTVNQFTASGLRYPLIDAPSGNVITTNGAGTLTLQPVAATMGFTSIAQQIFTTSGTYTPTAGMAFCIIECVGSGGGGGGVTSAAGHSAAAGGGGGGSYSKSLFNAATIGVSQVVTVGSAGFGAAPGANNGGDGSPTSVGVLIEADGGHGGFGSVASAAVISLGIFGAGGGSGTGQIEINGETGTLGTAYGPSQLGIGGPGGNSYYGRGGEELVNLPGANGFNYGSGGGGGSSGNTGNVGGGAGTGGIVIITEFIV